MPLLPKDKRICLACKFALGTFLLAFLLIFLAFCTPFWLEADGRFYGNKLEKMGLWAHCFRSLQDPQDYERLTYFTGCRWIFDPFTAKYNHIRGYLLPAFFVATQFFFTLCFICLLIACILIPIYLLCIGPEHKHFIRILQIIGLDLIGSATLGLIAVIIFGARGDGRDWMPDWENNYLSWSFALGVVGVFVEYISGVLFLVEARIQRMKLDLKESQATFGLESKSHAIAV